MPMAPTQMATKSKFGMSEVAALGFRAHSGWTAMAGKLTQRRKFRQVFGVIGRLETRTTAKPSIDVSKDAATSSRDQTRAPGAIFLESVTIKNFKNITELKLDLMRPSTLIGEWTCIAGINGAGKTSILQAICLVLLGGELVNELGRGHLGRVLQRTASGMIDAEIDAVVLRDGKRTRLYVP